MMNFSKIRRLTVFIYKYASETRMRVCAGACALSRENETLDCPVRQFNVQVVQRRKYLLLERIMNKNKKKNESLIKKEKKTNF